MFAHPVGGRVLIAVSRPSATDDRLGCRTSPAPPAVLRHVVLSAVCARLMSEPVCTARSRGQCMSVSDPRRAIAMPDGRGGGSRWPGSGGYECGLRPWRASALSASRRSRLVVCVSASCRLGLVVSPAWCRGVPGVRVFSLGCLSSWVCCALVPWCRLGVVCSRPMCLMHTHVFSPELRACACRSRLCTRYVPHARSACECSALLR